MNSLSPQVAALFLAPALAWAAVGLVGIPILVHLLNRRRHKIVRWAAMEYLLEAMRQNRRRLRLQDILLLTLRCAAIALVALALSRPVGCSQGMAGRLLGQQGGLHVLVIDNSGSMNYRADRPAAVTHLDQARRLAKRLVERLHSGQDAVAIVTTASPDGGASTLLPPTYDLAAAGAAVDTLEQTEGATDLAGALERAAEIARQESTHLYATLSMLTDGTQHAWQGAAAERLKAVGAQLAPLFRVSHYNLAAEGQSNAAVIGLESGSSALTTAVPADFSAAARYYGAGDSRLTLQWTLGQRAAATRENVALSSQAPPQLLSQAVLSSPGPLAVTARLLPEDRLPQDNARFAAFEVLDRLNVLVVEGDRGNSPLGGAASFLEIALAPTAAKAASPVAIKAITDLEFSSQALGQYNAVILASVSRLSAEQAQRLRTFVDEGGALLLFMGENINAEAWNAELTPRGLLPGTLTRRVQTAEGAEPQRFAFNPLGQIHPLLSVFRGEEKSGLTTARVFSYYQLAPAPSAERVLDFASGDPAIVLQRLGTGKVLFVATSADSRWTTLPAKPAYVALLHEVLAGTVSANDGWMTCSVGQPLVVPSRIPMAGAPRLLDPAGAAITLTAAATGSPTTQGAAAEAGYRSPPLQRVGLYRLETGQAVYPVAVNFPSSESDLRPLPNAALRQALGNIEMRLTGAELPDASAEDEAERRDFGWSLLAAAAILLCLEATLAMWFRR